MLNGLGWAPERRWRIRGNTGGVLRHVYRTPYWEPTSIEASHAKRAKRKDRQKDIEP